jgi:hypothetical protein
MATGKAEVWGHRSFLAQIAVPRPITRFGLIVVAGLLGQAAWSYLTLPLLAYVSGVAASFCILSAGAIWGMRDKADMAQDGDHLNAQEFKRARDLSREVRLRSTWRAAFVAICALAAASPAISQQFTEAVWQWMMIAAGVGVGEAAYGFMLANEWEEQLRAKRDNELLRAKELAERLSLIDRLESAKRESPVNDAGWTEASNSMFSQYKPH